MTIDYQSLIDAALLDIVRKILSDVQEEGLEDNQSFYISFYTDHPGVVLSRRVRQLYPEEITIVLQYQYKDLRVFKDKFSVNLGFGGVTETVEVPFLALTGFADPLSSFSLQFRESDKKRELANVPENISEFARAKP